MEDRTQEKALNRVKEAVGEKKARYLRPGECRGHMRRMLAREFEEIVEGFVAAAKKGSCPHVKLATELLKPPQKNPSKNKGSVAKFLERLDREQAERERLKKEQLETK